MLDTLLLKRMLKSQLKDVPESEQQKLIEMIEKHPQFFQTIAQEAQQKIASGKDKMTAMTEVMQEHEAELRKLTISDDA